MARKEEESIDTSTCFQGSSYLQSKMLINSASATCITQSTITTGTTGEKDHLNRGNNSIKHSITKDKANVFTCAKEKQLKKSSHEPHHRFSAQINLLASNLTSFASSFFPANLKSSSSFSIPKLTLPLTSSFSPSASSFKNTCSLIPLFLVTILTFTLFSTLIITPCHGYYTGNRNQPPIFIQTGDMSIITENLPVGSFVNTLKATDPEGLNLTYGLYGTSLLKVDSHTGTISTAAAIDREVVGDSIRFYVTVEDTVADPEDNHDKSNLVTVPVTVSLVDVNDNSPKFYNRYNLAIDESAGLRVNITEDSPIGSYLIQKLEITDPDTVGSALKVTCDDCNGKFKVQSVDEADINSSSSFLQRLQPLRPIGLPPGQSPSDASAIAALNSGLNYLAISVVLLKELEYHPKSRNQEVIHLIASDGLHNTSLPVYINIQDVQNKPPVFIGSTTAIVSEDTAIGTVVMKVKAYDGDAITLDALNNAITATIAGSGGGGGGNIHQNTNFGAASGAGSLGATGNSRQQSIHQPPVIGRPVVYELIQNPNDYFAINGKTGEITVANVLDKEAFPSTNGLVTIQVKAIETSKGKRIENDSLAESTVTLTITLSDVNDEPPKFNKEEYTVSVLEGVPNGTPLSSLDMVIMDKDSGSNSVFNLALIDPSGIFSVEPLVATGSTAVSIRVAKGPLDYENVHQRKFNLIVTATEAFTREKFFAAANVTVFVEDVNDNEPTFQQESYSARVVEDASPGSTVTGIHATDRDSPALTAMSYSLFGNGAELFNVDSTTGIVTVAYCGTPGSGNCIDYESRQSYFLSFQASDGFGQSAVVPLMIAVVDANDNAPIFARERYTAVIDEGSSKFEPPLRVKATDADATSVLSYSIIDGNSENLFKIEPATGEVKVNGPIRSKSQSVTLKVQVSDGGKGIATTLVTITIRDANDNAPVFDKAVYYATVSESAGPLTPVEQVHASDADTGMNAAIEYRILKGAFDEFTIDTVSGQVYVAPPGHTKLDFDRRSVYEIEISATDKGVPPKVGTTVLHITIINDNDKGPYFTPTSQRTTISEAVAVGTSIYTMKAIDPDTENDQSLSYRIVSSTAIDKTGVPIEATDPRSPLISNFFTIERITGQVFVHSRVNRDLASVVTLNISVTDVSSNVPQVAFGNLIITITDHNDHPPVFSLPWTPENRDLSVAVREEQPVGTVIMNLIATDEDSDISHYEIDPPSPYFEIGRTSGVITIKKTIDYETIVRESPPQELDMRSPKLPNQLRISVHAYDSGVPQLKATAIIHVTVLNINDNEPAFNQSSYKASIKENTAPGTFVAQVKATDGDYGKYGKISYSIISVSDNSGKSKGQNDYFTISNETGVIRVAKGAVIDRESGLQRITLQVAASDDVDAESENRSRRMISVPIYITIEDVNDSPPIFTRKEYDATTVGHADGVTTVVPVIQVTAKDADDDVIHGSVRYSILSGNINGVFQIDPKSGMISVIKPPIDVNPDTLEYSLKIEARDENGFGPYADTAIVNVKVVQVNRHKPRFLFPSQPSIEFTENQKPGTKVIRVQAYDEDTGDNGVVKFSFKLDGSHNSQETAEFKIDPDSGIITSKKSLDREAKDKYELVLSACDHLAEPQSFETLQQLTIVIKDLDDNKPEFARVKDSSVNSLIQSAMNAFTSSSSSSSGPQSSNSNGSPYIFSILENLPRGTLIGKVEASDADFDDENKSIFYYIIDGNQDQMFHLDKVTGSLYANVSFDREVKDEYELVIKASSKEIIIPPNWSPEQASRSGINVTSEHSTDSSDKSSSLNPVYLPSQSTPSSKIKTQFDFNQHQTTVPPARKTLSIMERSYNPSDLSLAYVLVRIKDVNDNKPFFPKQIYRSGVNVKSDIGSLVTRVKAIDLDAGVNSTLSYAVTSIDLFRRGYDSPDAPVRPIPSPFAFGDANGASNSPIAAVGGANGEIIALQLMSQYPIGSRFVLSIEAKERAAPFRTAQAKVHIWIYDPIKLIKITLRSKPELIHVRKDEIEELLSAAADYRVVVTEIRYHYDHKNNRLNRNWSDVFVLVVDDRTYLDVAPQRVISKLDTSSMLLQRKLLPVESPESLYIDSITLSSGVSSSGNSIMSTSAILSFEEDLDPTSIVFISLVSLICLGFITMGVSFCCLKSWYQQKLLSDARKSASKAASIAAGANGGILGGAMSTKSLSQKDLTGRSAFVNGETATIRGSVLRLSDEIESIGANGRIGTMYGEQGHHKVTNGNGPPRSHLSAQAPGQQVSRSPTM